MHFIAPRPPPFYQPSVQAGIARYEEDDAALALQRRDRTPLLRKTGSPRSATNPQGWDIASRTAGHTASFTFTGTWASLGLSGQTNTGQTEIFIDGASQGIFDTYRPTPQQHRVYLCQPG